MQEKVWSPVQGFWNLDEQAEEEILASKPGDAVVGLGGTGIGRIVEICAEKRMVKVRFASGDIRWMSAALLCKVRFAVRVNNRTVGLYSSREKAERVLGETGEAAGLVAF